VEALDLAVGLGMMSLSSSLSPPERVHAAEAREGAISHGQRPHASSRRRLGDRERDYIVVSMTPPGETKGGRQPEIKRAPSAGLHLAWLQRKR
jgi:hypothetical protein